MRIEGYLAVKLHHGIHVPARDPALGVVFDLQVMPAQRLRRDREVAELKCASGEWRQRMVVRAVLKAEKVAVGFCFE